MGNPKQPQPGDLSIDATALASSIVDNPKGTGRRLRKLRAGYEAALACLQNADPNILKRAGIDPTQVTAGTTASGVVDEAATFLPASKKLVEVLTETSQKNADIIAGVIAEAAAQAKRRAKKDPNPDQILGALEPVLLYQSAPATKGVTTKIKTGKLKPKTPKQTKQAKTAAAKAAPAPAPAPAPATTPTKA